MRPKKPERKGTAPKTMGHLVIGPRPEVMENLKAASLSTNDNPIGRFPRP